MRKIMRLDKFLKVSRILKRRSVANSACDGGRVTVNDRPAKPAVQLKLGDIVCVRFGNSSLTFKVLSLDEHVRKEDTSAMYKVVDENRL